MRLINTSTLEFQESFDESPRYAILSHRWGSGEATLRSFDEYRRSTPAKNVFDNRRTESPQRSQSTPVAGIAAVIDAVAETNGDPESEGTSKGIRKAIEFCRIARERGLEWAWLDTVSIDKTSSVELSEAINSMYTWYQEADICIVYLPDVQAENCSETFAKSEWFTRGWTLQELLAPKNIVFYDAAWKQFGTKESLRTQISDITGIPGDVLSRPWLSSFYSGAQRMSWASNRKTTRAEDIAYCLLGLFDVNMELMYGEGAHKAFQRLQLKFLEDVDDESLFTWDLGEDDKAATAKLTMYNTETKENQLVDICRLTGLLATRPQQFSRCGHTKLTNQYASEQPARKTSRGLEFVNRAVRTLKHVKIISSATPTPATSGNTTASNSTSSTDEALVRLMPLPCEGDIGGVTRPSWIIIAEDIVSKPIQRWCRVILSERWMKDGRKVLANAESEILRHHYFVRNNWPQVEAKLLSRGSKMSQSSQSDQTEENRGGVRSIGRFKRPIRSATDSLSMR